MFINGIEIVLVSLAGMGNTRVIDSTDPVTIRLELFNNGCVSADVIGVPTSGDQMIDSVDIVTIKILDDTATVLSPVAGIDEDRLSSRRPEQHRIGSSDIDVMNIEFTVNICGSSGSDSDSCSGSDFDSDSESGSSSVVSSVVSSGWGSGSGSEASSIGSSPLPTSAHPATSNTPTSATTRRMRRIRFIFRLESHVCSGHAIEDFTVPKQYQ